LLIRKIAIMIFVFFAGAILTFAITKENFTMEKLQDKSEESKDAFANETKKLTLITPVIEFQSEGGIIDALYHGGDLIRIEGRFFRSLFQTKETFSFYDDSITFDKITYRYEEAMDTSGMSILEESYVIIENDIYVKEFDMEENAFVFVLYEEENTILQDLERFIDMIESSEEFNSSADLKLKLRN